MTDTTETILSQDETGGLGRLRLRHPPGTFAPSPATCATLRAVAEQRDSLTGTGFDWGCGVGALAIAAARIDAVERVLGMDLHEANIAAARENAALNGVDKGTVFVVADSFSARDATERASVEALRGSADFLLANPPHSASNDGFDFRRRVLREGARFLRPGGIALVQALSAYGPHRVEALANDLYVYEGVVFRTELVSLDYQRAQIRHQMGVYLKEERRGGRPYEFHVGSDQRGPVAAHEAQAAFDAGDAVLGRWQVHLFRRIG